MIQKKNEQNEINLHLKFITSEVHDKHGNNKKNTYLLEGGRVFVSQGLIRPETVFKRVK